LATFADRFLVLLSDPANVGPFLADANLDSFLTSNFQARFNTEFWQIAQVALGAARTVNFQSPIWTELRIMGRGRTSR
jgi:hypothetical protein